MVQKLYQQVLFRLVVCRKKPKRQTIIFLKKRGLLIVGQHQEKTTIRISDPLISSLRNVEKVKKSNTNPEVESLLHND